MRVDPVELSWVGDAFGPPPATPPAPDWRLAEWVRAQAGRAGRKRLYDSARWLALRRRVIAEPHGRKTDPFMAMVHAFVVADWIPEDAGPLVFASPITW